MSIRKFPLLDFSKNQEKSDGENQEKKETDIEKIEISDLKSFEHIIPSNKVNDYVNEYASIMYLDQVDQRKPNFIRISSEEFDRIKSEAFNKGKEEGLHEGVNKNKLEEKEAPLNEDQTAQTIKKIDKKLESLEGQLAITLGKWHDNCITLAYAIAERVIDDVATYVPVNIIEEFLKKHLALFHHDITIAIEVNDSCFESVKKLIDHMVDSNHYGFTINVYQNKEIELGDCKIKWSDGEFIKNKEIILKEIKKILDNYLSNYCSQ